MALSPIEAVDLLRFADVFSERLAAATAELSRKRGLDLEKAWMETALSLVDGARKPAFGLVGRARVLPELSELREEFAASLQNAWIDAFEKLVAGITFHVSARSPLIEALFPHQKFAPLRKAPREVAEKFQKDFEKRMKSGYVSRMLATDDFTFAKPVLEKVAAAWGEFIGSFDAAEISEAEAAPIRAELVDVAERVELSLRQARLLAEAALVPVSGAFEASQLGAKPKKRSKVAAFAAAVEMPAETLESIEEVVAEAEAAAELAEAAGRDSADAEGASAASQVVRPELSGDAAESKGGHDSGLAPRKRARGKRAAAPKEDEAVATADAPVEPS